MKVILIVDDEYVILETLRLQIMRLTGPDTIIEAASSAEEAYQVLKELSEQGQELVLTISDFNLGDAKGTDVLNFTHVLFPQAHKAILSGQSDIKVLDEFHQKIGLDAFISKPWNYDILSSLVQKAVA